MWSLTAGGLYVQVQLVQVSMRNHIQGEQKIWSLETGGLIIRVVAKEGFTVLSLSNMYFRNLYIKTTRL